MTNLSFDSVSFIHALAMAPSGDPSAPGGGLMGFLPMILIFVAFWFLLIAPQRKKQKEHDKMIKAWKKVPRSRPLVECLEPSPGLRTIVLSSESRRM
jgi:hypothetical protein